MVGDNVSNGLCISSGSRSTAINVVCDSCQFVRDTIRNVCTHCGLESAPMTTPPSNSAAMRDVWEEEKEVRNDSATEFDTYTSRDFFLHPIRCYLCQVSIHGHLVQKEGFFVVRLHGYGLIQWLEIDTM